MKRIILMIMTILIIISTIGCTESDLENYKAAMEKTDNMNKGIFLTEVNTTLDINTEGLEIDILKDIEKFRESKVTMKSSFDKDLKRAKDEGYIFVGDLGYDFNIYNVDDRYFLEPLFINSMDKRFIEIKLDEMLKDTEISEDIFRVFADKWSEILKEENVTKGEKVLITTDDGEVKSREFTISLNDAQLKELLLYMIDYLEKSEEYKNLLRELTYFPEDIEITDAKKEEIYTEVINKIKKFINDAQELSIFYKAYIDIDNYVVKEDISFNFKNDTQITGELKYFKFQMVNQYTSIEKEQKLDFEAPESKDILNLDDIDWEEFKW